MSSLLSVNAFAPVIRQGTDSFHERLQTEAESWVISLPRGYDTATFTLRGEQDYLVEWYTNGLVRDIVFRDRDGASRWNGFVTRLALNIGGVTRTKSLEAFANRVLFVYTALDTSANPPVAGAQATITVDDTASQARYGIKTAIVSGREATTATATAQATHELAVWSQIVESETQIFGQGSPPFLTAELRGYAHMLDWFNYEQTGVSGTADADVVLAAILAADPNSVVSTVTTDIDANDLQIEQFQDGKMPSWGLVQKIVDRGRTESGTGQRWSAGIYSNRRLTYKRTESIDSRGNALSTNKYLLLTRHLADAGDRIFDETGREIFPWEVRPDRLIKVSGLPGYPTLAERVQYTAPVGLTIQGRDPLNPMLVMVSQEQVT